MSSPRPVISVVCPCFNEGEVIDVFYRELKRVLVSDCAEFDHLILFVDDGSSDGTLPALERLADEDERVCVYSLSRNFGHQIALSAGLDHAEGDAVIFLDSDLQHPPSVIPRLIEQWREGNDVVQAVRGRTEGAGLLKRFTSAASQNGSVHFEPLEELPPARPFGIAFSGSVPDGIRGIGGIPCY